MCASISRCFRPTLSATIIVALLLGGCASPQTVMPIGQDHAELVATVARRGQESPNVANVHQVEVPDPYESPGLKAAAKVAGTTAGVAALCVAFAPLAALAALGHGNLSGLRPDLKPDS
jgi:hypothetical protein